ncbi:MAG: GNAT family N-acetyltransferase [Caldilineaceae bacterium]|nr:GNAT family N-acetyltransferase [Caldilineaceae bacterium]
MSGTLIRRATAGDTAPIARLLRAAYAEYRGRLDPPSGVHEETAAGVAALRAREDAFVADRAGRIIGCAFYDVGQQAGRRRCWLHRVAVLPGERGQGLGRALVNAVEQAMLIRGVRLMELGVRIPLTDNHRFWQEVGYRIVDARAHDGYDLPTFYVLRKDLGDEEEPFLMRHIVVVEYDDAWPVEFAAEAARIAPLFGDNLVRIHHVGSTSVPGLAAKPIIDMLPLVKDIRRVDAVIPRMIDAGYQAMGEFGLPGRRYFKRDTDGERTHHVHVYAAGDPNARRHLAFPAYLRHHPAGAARYAACKRAAATDHPDDIIAYMDYKDGLIKELEAEALAWYAEVEIRD